MRATSHLLKKSPSSSRWLQRQSHDPYVRQRTIGGDVQDTYRSRSAFKLVSLAQRYPTLLGRGKTVVDLGAAPGGWSQVAANKGSSRVIAVDLLDMEPIKRVDFIRGNFLDHAVQQQVAELTGRGGELGKVDTVLSDMMASMTGVRDRDVQASLDLVTAATAFGIQTLKPATKLERELDETEECLLEDKLMNAGGKMVSVLIVSVGVCRGRH